MIKLQRPQCPNVSALASGNYKHPENKNALQEASFNKCMYCESKVTHTYYGDVEHIKPKAKYPKLEFDWKNLGFVCAVCNGLKRDVFDETTPFVNPYEENPEDYLIASGALLLQKQGSERGEITVSQIGLNRSSLIERRKEKLGQVGKAIDACFRTVNQDLKNAALSELAKEAGADKEYSLCVKHLLIAHQV